MEAVLQHTAPGGREEGGKRKKMDYQTRSRNLDRSPRWPAEVHPPSMPLAGTVGVIEYVDAKAYTVRGWYDRFTAVLTTPRLAVGAVVSFKPTASLTPDIRRPFAGDLARWDAPESNSV